MVSEAANAFESDRGIRWDVKLWNVFHCLPSSTYTHKCLEQELVKTHEVIAQTFCGCSGFVSVAVTNTITKRNLRRQRFLWLTLLGHSPSSKGSPGRNPGQEPEGRDHGGMLLIGAFIPQAQLAFLYSQGLPVLGWCHPLWAGLSGLNQQCGHCHRHGYRPA